MPTLELGGKLNAFDQSVVTVSAYCLQVISAAGNVLSPMRVCWPPVFPGFALSDCVGSGGLGLFLDVDLDGFVGLGLGVGVALVNHAQYGFDVDRQAVIIDVMYCDIHGGGPLPHGHAPSPFRHD
jgi:hypothetical protein